MIYCGNCGSGLQDDALFCPECGTKTENIAASSSPIKSSVPETQIVQESVPVVPVTVAPVVEAPPPPKQYCRNCGKEVAAGAYACIGCGLPPMKAFNFCPSCGSNCHQDAVICIKCGIKLESQDSAPKTVTEKVQAKAFCRNCGKEVLKEAVACLNCGLPPKKSKNFCPSCGSETHNEAIICIKCGTALEEFAAAQSQRSSSETQKASSNQGGNVVIVGTQKSVGTAFILALFFGPLGLFYASVTGGILMIFINIIVIVTTAGLGLIFTQIICIIWAVVAAQNANQAALNKAGTIANNMNRQ